MDISTHTTMSHLDSEPNRSMGDVSMSRISSDPHSPMSAGPLGASTLSMREKAARKRRITAQHSNNFRAGYVPVQEEALHRTGVRGRKRYLLYAVIAILLVIAVLNTLVTAWLLYILGMTRSGLFSLEFVSLGGRDFLRVLTEARIVNMTFKDASVGARFNSSLVFESKHAPLEVSAMMDNKSSSITLKGNNITFVTNQFEIQDDRNQASLLISNIYSMETVKAMRNVYVSNQVTARKIEGISDFKDLHLESEQNEINIAAARDVNAISKKTIAVEGHNIFLNSQKSITLATKGGIYFSGLPVITTTDRINPDLLTYKVCVCRSGSLFTVPVTRPGVSCDLGTQLRSICQDDVS